MLALGKRTTYTYSNCMILYKGDVTSPHDNVMGWKILSGPSLQWRHNGRDRVSNHQPRECLLNHLIRYRSKKTSKFRVTGLCEGNSPETAEFPTQRASNAENISIWWRIMLRKESAGNRWITLQMASYKHTGDTDDVGCSRRHQS